MIYVRLRMFSSTHLIGAYKHYDGISKRDHAHRGMATPQLSLFVMMPTCSSESYKIPHTSFTSPEPTTLYFENVRLEASNRMPTVYGLLRTADKPLHRSNQSNSSRVTDFTSSLHSILPYSGLKKKGWCSISPMSCFMCKFFTRERSGSIIFCIGILNIFLFTFTACTRCSPDYSA